jgi:hypothetical protein
MRQKGKAEGTITGTEVINCQRKVYKLYIQKHLLVLHGPTTFMFCRLFSWHGSWSGWPLGEIKKARGSNSHPYLLWSWIRLTVMWGSSHELLLWYDGLSITPKFNTVFVTRGSVRGKYINCICKSIYWSCMDQILLCSAAYSHDRNIIPGSSFFACDDPGNAPQHNVFCLPFFQHTTEEWTREGSIACDTLVFESRLIQY